MKKSREFDNILDECLQRLVQGESIEACLSQYPEHAAELEPLLRTALDTLRATDIKPRPEFRQQASYEFQAAIREMPVKEGRGFFGIFKPWLVTLIVVVVVLAAGSGTVVAAGNSLPDSPLYPVKLATESVRLALTPSALGKAELYAKFADERVEEIIMMADKGNSDLVDKATDRLNEQLIAVANLDITQAVKDATLTSEAPEEARLSEAAEPAPKALIAPSPTPPPTTTPTATPAPTVVPTPEDTAPPATTAIIPAPQAEPPVVVVAPPEGQKAEATYKETFGLDAELKPDKHQKLKQELADQALRNLQALREKLEKAPESLKPSLQRAIEIAEEAYEEALKNLNK